MPVSECVLGGAGAVLGGREGEAVMSGSLSEVRRSVLEKLHQ